MNKTSAWSFRKKLTYAVLTSLFIFLVLEIIFRLLFFINYHRYHTSVYIQGSALQVADSQLVYKNLPCYLDYDLKYQNNVEGMRSLPGDISISKKQKDDFWVLLLGGSAIEGMGSNKVGDWLDITGVEDYPAKETIAFKLQQLLQQRLPAKRVKVFNAANSGYILWQSMARYQELKNKIDADWVISMDGNNDTASISNEWEVRQALQADWKAYPIFKSPSKYIIPVTKHSAFVNFLKQKIYHFKNNQRQEKNQREHYPARTKWLQEKMKPVELATPDSSILRAANFYLKTLQSFDSVLTHDSKKHLLILQPFLYNRDVNLSDSTEQAVYTYYTHAFNEPVNHCFRKIVADSVFRQSLVNKNLLVLNANFRNDAPVFVDYCHFTQQASDSIAQMLANHILQ